MNRVVFLLTVFSLISLSNTYAQINFIERIKNDTLKADSIALDSNLTTIDTTIYLIDTIEGSINISADARLNEMIQKQIQINKSECPDLVKGYRVQIYSASGAGSNQKAREMRTKFLTSFPNIPAYQNFDQTDFKVRVGNCRSKLEAEKIKKEINQEFPGCFIVPDYIETEVTQTCD